ncbi:hypothetical protein FQA47_024073 [Oryzias melastigma]|uniref:Uncharacterized protein n=1 Tax=Oryzias melastigma TaxID=30732 RepID=A0A834F316_ORYME|nr:hypothetical protein FQA47_024073 [Oryzias melastigma]
MIQKCGAVLAVLVLTVHVLLLVAQAQALQSNSSTNSSAVSTMGGSSCSTLLLPLVFVAPLLYRWFQ